MDPFTKWKAELATKADEWDASRRATIDLLTKLAQELDDFQREIERNKRNISIAGMVGGGLTLVGIGMSVFTGGASLGLTAVGATVAGAGVSVASGVAGFVQYRKENQKNTETVEAADRAVAAFTQTSIAFMDSLKKLQKLANQLKISLEFKDVRIVKQRPRGTSETETFYQNLLGPSAGVVVCSSTMVSALSALGLTATRSVGAAARVVDTGVLSVVSLVGTVVKYVGITDRVSKFASGVSSLRGLAAVTSGVGTRGLTVLNSAGKIVSRAGGALSLLTVGLDFKTFLDSSIKMHAERPSVVADKIREMTKQLQKL